MNKPISITVTPAELATIKSALILQESYARRRAEAAEKNNSEARATSWKKTAGESWHAWDTVHKQS